MWKSFCEHYTDVKKNGAVVSHYEYDSNGNRTSATVNGNTASATYDNQDRLLTYGSLSFTYSENGELKSKSNTSNNETTNYTYDVFGNLRKVELPNGLVVEYLIDGLNRRVAKKLNGTLMHGFVYRNDLSPFAEIDASGNVISRFIYGTKQNVPDYLVKGDTTYRIISDRLGSVRLVINGSDGSIAQRIDYDEFGNITLDTNPGFQPFGFAGGVFDPHTKLTRFGARDYDPEVGRWTAKDPIIFQGNDPNLFRYVVNDPVNFVDPNGQWTRSQLLGAGGGALLLIGGIAVGAGILVPTATLASLLGVSTGIAAKLGIGLVVGGSAAILSGANLLSKSQINIIDLLIKGANAGQTQGGSCPK